MVWVAAVREAVKFMGKGGRVITIGSGGGDIFSFPGAADYAATKAAVAAYGRGWSRDVLCDRKGLPRCRERAQEFGNRPPGRAISLN